MKDGKKIIVVGGGCQTGILTSQDIRSDWSKQVEYAGGNTGNLVFKYGIVRSLGAKNCDCLKMWEFLSENLDFGFINATYSGIVCPCAN